MRSFPQFLVAIRRRTRVHNVGGLLAAALALSACAPSKAKLTAISSVTSLQSVIDQSLEDSNKAVHLLVQEAITQHRKALAAQWQHEQAKLILSIHLEFDRAFDKAQSDITTRLNDALSPIEKRLKNQIAEQQAIKAPEGNTAADSLRLQLASTLAVFQREGAKLELEAKARLDKAKATLLAEVSQDFASPPDPIGKPVTTADVDAILKDYDANSDQIRADIKGATEALREYVTLDEPWKYVLKGALGQRAAALLAPRFDQFAAKANEALNNKAMELLKKFNPKASATASDAAQIPRP